MAFIARANRPHMPGIRRVGIKHEAILNYLLANPLVKMRDVAAHFKVSQPWLSLIVHSDAFQKKLRERQDIHFDTSILPAMEKVQLVADIALDRLIENLPYETDTAKLNAVADKALSRLGYGTGEVGTQVNVQVNVDRSMLERARGLIGAGAQRPVLEGNHESKLVGEVPASGEGAMGATCAYASLSPAAGTDTA